MEIDVIIPLYKPGKELFTLRYIMSPKENLIMAAPDVWV